jgi:hypothetical protein
MNQERRRWPRVKVELPCEVQLLMPEDTFQPHHAHGTILDLSIRGVKLRIAGLPTEIFRRLLHPNRYVKLTFSSPESEEKVKAIGKIVWMHFVSEEQLLDVGTYFEKVEPETEKVLQKIVEQHI